MKWLLISRQTRSKATPESNVGDEFILLGIQRVIRQADPQAQFDVLDANDEKAWKPRPFDKAVVCGLPMFFSMPHDHWPGVQNCWDIWWWPRIYRGWPSAVRERFLVWGVGHLYVDRIVSLLDYASAINEVLNRAWALVVREPIIDHPRVIDSVCPSAFSMLDRTRKPEVALCNFMENGGHYGHQAKALDAWNKQLPALAKLLQDSGFRFVAHTGAERQLAKKLGWTTERILFYDTAEAYLDLFSRATFYFGNRMHGAAVCAALGVPTWATTFDCRLGMVSRLGGKVSLPNAATPELVKCWLDETYRPTPTPFDVRTEFVRMTKLVKRFMDELEKEPWTE